jgi:hypothetical protein
MAGLVVGFRLSVAKSLFSTVARDRSTSLGKHSFQRLAGEEPEIAFPSPQQSPEMRKVFSHLLASGEVAEWLKAPVLKTGIRENRIGGSNPSLSASTFVFLQFPFFTFVTWVLGWNNGIIRANLAPLCDRGAESSSPVTSRHMLCSLFVRLLCIAVVYLIPGCQTHPVLPRCTPRNSRIPGPTVLRCGFSKPPPSASRPLSGAWFSIAYHNCLASHAVNGAHGSCSSERSADLFSTVMPWQIIVVMQADALKQPSSARLLTTRRRSVIALALTGFVFMQAIRGYVSVIQNRIGFWVFLCSTVGCYWP